MKKFMSLFAISILTNSLVSSTINLTNNTKLGQEIKQNLGMINNPFISEFSNLSDVDVYNSVVASDGTIYVGTDKGVYKTTDGTNFSQMNGLNIGITSISSDKNGTIYVGTAYDGLYKSTDGTNFTPVSGINFDIYYINCIAIAPDGTIYVGAEAWSSDKEGLLYISKDGTNFTSDTGISEIINDLYISDGTLYFTTGTYKTKRSLYKANLLDYLLDIKKSYYYGDKYNGLVYNQEQKINIKQEYLKNAVLDGATITIPATNVNLDKGTHTLILNLKDEYKQYINLFGGNSSTGQISYNFWIKTAIDSNDLNYLTNSGDTDLLTGLISDLGNTINCPIIQTRTKYRKRYSCCYIKY